MLFFWERPLLFCFILRPFGAFLIFISYKPTLVYDRILLSPSHAGRLRVSLKLLPRLVWTTLAWAPARGPPPCLCKCGWFCELPTRSAGGLGSFEGCRRYFEEKFARALWMFQATERAVCTRLPGVTGNITNKSTRYSGRNLMMIWGSFSSVVMVAVWSWPVNCT
jgi:hypothetical protein